MDAFSVKREIKHENDPVAHYIRVYELIDPILSSFYQDSAIDYPSSNKNLHYGELIFLSFPLSLERKKNE